MPLEEKARLFEKESIARSKVPTVSNGPLYCELYSLEKFIGENRNATAATANCSAWLTGTLAHY